MKTSVKLLIILIIIFAVLVSVSSMSAGKKSKPITITSTSTRATSTSMIPTVEFSANLSCEDGTLFTAEFLTNDKVRIRVGGEVARVIPLAAGNAKVYENADYKYAFAGQVAYVESKTTGRSTSCIQPVNPVNFGGVSQ